jgi:uroporphyrinogen decarboxylase
MGIAYNNLKKHLTVGDGETKIYDVPQQLCIPEPWYLDRFQVDAVDLARNFAGDPEDWIDWQLPDGSPAKLPGWLDIKKKGDSWIVANSEGEFCSEMPPSSYYFDQKMWPLLGVHKENFDDLGKDMGRTMWAYLSDPLWKNGGRPDFYDFLREKAKHLYEETEYAIMIGFGANLFEWGQFLYRTDEFLVNIMAYRDEMENMLDKLTEIHMQNLEPVLEAVSPYVQVIQMGDDLGMQSGPMLSPELYHEMFFPRHKKIFRMVKEKTDMAVFLHSCGAIADFLPDLIEGGVDIINPVQITAEGMEPSKLKREYGKDLVFWGGGVDTQRTLPLGTPADVREEVKRNTEILMKNGGFIFTQVHNIQAGVSPENIIAMYDEVNNIRY